jgi:hypothetical protein
MSKGIETIQGNTFDAIAKPESFSLAGQQQQIEDYRRSIQNDPGAVGSADAKAQAIRDATETRMATLLSDDQRVAFAICKTNAMQSWSTVIDRKICLLHCTIQLADLRI